MPVNDQTFQATCVARVKGVRLPLIYAHPEAGGPDEDLMRVTGFLHKNCDAELKRTMEFARQTAPHSPWEYCRVLWQVVPFDDPAMVESLIQADIRRRAEAKLRGAGLTADEMRSLGL